MTPAEKAIVAASKLRSSDVVKQTKSAPTPVERPDRHAHTHAHTRKPTCTHAPPDPIATRRAEETRGGSAASRRGLPEASASLSLPRCGPSRALRAGRCVSARARAERVARTSSL
eukprot:415058-Pleurochrysis_carterae.AAC.2